MDESLSSAAIALLQIAEPFRFLMLVLGVLLGLVVGVVPGLGGLVGLTLLLPFTFHLDPYTALAVLIGMHAVVATSDSIPAVLFGVPGTVGSAATIVDGYPMSRRGEAGRALGAAFTASMLGGLIGVTMLAIAIPVLRPLMLSIASPEMFAFCIFGISLAASLSGKHVMRGLAAAAIGLVLAMVGEDYQSGTMRWTFDTIYLWSGIPLVPLALGLFAIPEIADLVVKKTSIAGDGTANRQTKGQFIGAKDVLRNPVVLFRSSGIGAVLGALPGLGSAVIDWIAYGATARSRVKNARFGDGDVRGVIASEAANNAKEGGALVPTLIFGIPGSGGTAVLLGGLVLIGIQPGPRMVTQDIDTVYLIIWSLALANVIGAMVCIGITPLVSRVTEINYAILAPAMIAIVMFGAFQATRNWGDLIAVVLIGVTAFVFKRMHWPRPPLLIGFVLAGGAEVYLYQSVQLYGMEWLGRPIVLILIALTAVSVFFGARSKVSTETGVDSGDGLARRPGRVAQTALTVAVAAVGAAAIADAWNIPWISRLFPFVVGSAVIAFAALSLLPEWRVPALSSPGQPVFEPRNVRHFGWIVGLLGLTAAIGFLPSVFLFSTAFLLAEARIRPLPAMAMAAAIIGVLWTLGYALTIRFPAGLVNLGF